jgi:phosphoglycerate kinase
MAGLDPAISKEDSRDKPANDGVDCLMPRIRTLDNLDLGGKRAVIRVDLNVPLENGEISDLTRIDRILPGLREVIARGAAVILLSHFGRPNGKVVADMSLKPIAPTLANLLGRPVEFVATDWHDNAPSQASASVLPGQVLLLENTRFHPGEETNDPEFARRLASLGDVFINDAFSAAHRAHASTVGIAHLLPAAAGHSMQAELEALEKALEQPDRPLAAIVGGAKISTKLDLLANLITKVDTLIIGGGMANTFLAAQGIDIGKSLCEHDLFNTARNIMNSALAKSCTILLPTDVSLAEELRPGVGSRIAPVTDVHAGEMILDIGPKSIELANAALDRAATLVWNGPFGAFEIEPFDRATVAVALYAAERTRNRKLVSIAGGGDTVAALNQAGVADDFTYVSTAGGAFLEWLEGKTLPGVKVLEL